MLSTSNRQQLTLLDELLKVDLIVRLGLPHSGNNLFHAFSYILYSTTKYHMKVRYLIEHQAKLKFQSMLSDYSIRFQSPDICSYLINPLLPGFESLNLELFSRLFGIKMKLYYLNEMSLCCDIFNIDGPRTVKLVKVHDFHYEPLLSMKELDTYSYIQNLVLNMIGEVLGGENNGFSNFYDGTLINFEMKSWSDQMRKSQYVTQSQVHTDYQTYKIGPFAFNDSNDGNGLQNVLSMFEEQYNNKKCVTLLDKSEGIWDNPSDCSNDDSYNNSIEQDFNHHPIENSYPYYDQNNHDKNSSFNMYNIYQQFTDPCNYDFNSHYLIDPYQLVFDQRALSDINDPYQVHHNFINERHALNNTSISKQPYNIDTANDAMKNHMSASQLYESIQNSSTISDKLSVEENKTYLGVLKFFDDKNNFGFLTLPDHPSVDVFVFGSEFQKSNISINMIKGSEYGAVVKFKFEIVFYWGRHGKSKKAVNISIT